ncbi:hypothetical protein TTHERM_00780840 (macronuclear) [Tetrahymena thermophila SB210]|uniref:Uncharacterized protein n=1 Tax=Tetrahymena thermophila (strain SB210) TaxID=312017 RepID=I7M496_TETTS|nr:hypothetical protein TTHERM_00780840 [Tetrahymena thermophila SB210]EAS05995.2 hypothetical protein TTHERM_00780840 [Tetrahymena thermophila SB210]|eukprot:XP_001026240.2 hypothetical protein TTHERM_00780840 [Tetrahymena thermophila SB210]
MVQEMIVYLSPTVLKNQQQQASRGLLTLQNSQTQIKKGFVDSSQIMFIPLIDSFLQLQLLILRCLMRYRSYQNTLIKKIISQMARRSNDTETQIKASGLQVNQFRFKEAFFLNFQLNTKIFEMNIQILNKLTNYSYLPSCFLFIQNLLNHPNNQNSDWTSFKNLLEQAYLILKPIAVPRVSERYSPKAFFPLLYYPVLFPQVNALQGKTIAKYFQNYLK